MEESVKAPNWLKEISSIRRYLPSHEEAIQKERTTYGERYIEYPYV